MKCCKKSNKRSEDEELRVITQQDSIPEPTQPEPQPQNTIVDDAPENEQEEEETVVLSPVQCWKAQVEMLSSDIQMQVESLDEDEDQFWKELIAKYLEPLQNDKEKQERMKNDLQELRNKINFSFFFLNALWIVAAFLFQVFEVFQIKIPIVDLNLEKTGGNIQIEPMGLMFILGFALSVVLQFIGMFYHRVLTLIHYVAFLETEPKQQKSAMKKMDSVSNVDSRSGNSSSADLNDTTQEDLESNFSDRDSETDLSELDLED